MHRPLIARPGALLWITQPWLALDVDLSG